MFTDPEKEAIRRSWRLVVPIAETAADLFYRRLFELRPECRVLFPSDLSSQKQKLVKMLAFVVEALDWSDDEWETPEVELSEPRGEEARVARMTPPSVEVTHLGLEES
jgi:hypothetical protein